MKYKLDVDYFISQLKKEQIDLEKLDDIEMYLNALSYRRAGAVLQLVFKSPSFNYINIKSYNDDNFDRYTEAEERKKTFIDELVRCGLTKYLKQDICYEI